MPVTWLKRKYRPYGSHDWWAPKYPKNNNHGRRRKRNKTGETQVPVRQKVLVLGIDMKLRWSWR